MYLENLQQFVIQQLSKYTVYHVTYWGNTVGKNWTWTYTISNQENTYDAYSVLNWITVLLKVARLSTQVASMTDIDLLRVLVTVYCLFYGKVCIPIIVKVSIAVN